MDINKHIAELRGEALKRRLFRIILFIVFPAYIVHSCVTSYLYTVFYNNVELRSFSIIFDILNDVIDLFAFFICYAVVIYGLYRLSFKEIKKTFYLALFSPAFKYVLKLAFSFVGYTKIDLTQLWMGVYSFSISCVLEMIQFLLIIFISKAYIDKYKKIESVVNKASKTIGDSASGDLEVIPFKHIFSLKNPLQRGSFISAVIVSILRIIMLAINDISKGIYAVDFGGYMLLVGGYILEAVIGVIGYMFMLYIFITLASKEEKV